MKKITDLKELKKKAYEMRLQVMKMLKEAGSGHAAGALSAADIFTFMYFNYLKHDPKNPAWEDRDYFLVSNGHICSVWYAVLAHTGYFPVEDLLGYRKLGSNLYGHPHNLRVPGIFNSSGALAHGEAQASGVALGLKMDGRDDQRVYCYTSDGEHQEGAIWENALIAAKYKLNNLTIIMDNNDIQIDGVEQEIMPMPNMARIYEECGWNVAVIDGHDFVQIKDALKKSEPDRSTRPNFILANTTAGKGVTEMEDKFRFHDWRGNEDIADRAIAELENFLEAYST